jgi:hypothetical protein
VITSCQLISAISVMPSVMLVPVWMKAPKSGRPRKPPWLMSSPVPASLG